MAYIVTCGACDKPFMLVIDRPGPVRDSAKEVAEALADGHRVDRMAVAEAKALASFGWCECGGEEVDEDESNWWDEIDACEQWDDDEEGEE